VPYYWLGATLAALRGIEPHEVLQALAAQRRLPAPAMDASVMAFGIYAAASSGRPLVVTVRRSGNFDWWILGGTRHDER
jgi:hypothetical protein